MIWQMGPLPQTPTDVIVPLTLVPYVADQSTMCQTCVHADDIAGEIFHEINQSLNGPLAMEDMVTSTRSMGAWLIRKEGQQMLIGYQMEWSIIQEYPVSNDLITVSIYSQHVTIHHRGCVYGQMVRAHVTIPRHSDSSLMGILEKRISACFTNYCMELVNGLRVYAVTKDFRMEQEWQHIYYDFYLMAAPMFELLLGFMWVGDQQLPTPPHINVLQALCLENSVEDVRTLGLTVEDDFFN
jgi:hypothetical protein